VFFFILYLLIAIVILITVAFFYVFSIAATPPKGRADDLSKELSLKSGRVIACIGDSLTHGNIGECWVEVSVMSIQEIQSLMKALMGMLFGKSKKE